MWGLQEARGQANGLVSAINLVQYYAFLPFGACTGQVPELLEGLQSPLIAAANASTSASTTRAMLDLPHLSPARRPSTPRRCSAIPDPRLVVSAGRLDDPWSRLLLQVVAEAVMARLPEFSTQGIGNVAWGFSAVGHYHKDMYSLIAREIPPHLAEFLPQELSNVLLGFARFGHLDPGLLKVCQPPVPMAPR